MGATRLSPSVVCRLQVRESQEARLLSQAQILEPQEARGIPQACPPQVPNPREGLQALPQPSQEPQEIPQPPQEGCALPHTPQEGCTFPQPYSQEGPEPQSSKVSQPLQPPQVHTDCNLDKCSVGCLWGWDCAGRQ